MVRARLGQNYLKDIKEIRKIVSCLDKKIKTILEIGPGKGAITKELLNNNFKVVAIEKDKELVKHLEILFSKEIKERRLRLINDDIRNNSWEKEFKIKKYSLVGNIPYYITGQIIKKFLTRDILPYEIIFVLQKEVAHRIAKDVKNSILSLSVLFFGETKYMGTIKKTAFSPKPKIDSSILKIFNIKNTSKKIEEEYFYIIKTAFKEKRKVVLKKFNKEYREIFIKEGIDEKTRAEDIPFSIWKKIASRKMSRN